MDKKTYPEFQEALALIHQLLAQPLQEVKSPQSRSCQRNYPRPLAGSDLHLGPEACRVSQQLLQGFEGDAHAPFTTSAFSELSFLQMWILPAARHSQAADVVEGFPRCFRSP